MRTRHLKWWMLISHTYSIHIHTWLNIKYCDMGTSSDRTEELNILGYACSTWHCSWKNIWNMMNKYWIYFVYYFQCLIMQILVSIRSILHSLETSHPIRSTLQILKQSATVMYDGGDFIIDTEMPTSLRSKL